MRPLRFTIEESIHRILGTYAPRASIENETHEEKYTTSNSKCLAAITRPKTLLWKEGSTGSFKASLVSDDTKALASRVVASGLAQGCIGFSLTIAGALFNRLTEARSYYISRIPRPLHPPREPIIRPAIEQGIRATSIGIQTSLIDELLIKWRGEEKAASNAFWSGFLISSLENRKGGPTIIVEEGLKGGITSFLFHMILGGAEDPAAPLESVSRSNAQHSEDNNF